MALLNCIYHIMMLHSSMCLCICVLQNSIFWNWLKMTTAKKNIIKFIESNQTKKSRVAFHSLEFWRYELCNRKEKTNIIYKIVYDINRTHKEKETKRKEIFEVCTYASTNNSIEINFHVKVIRHLRIHHVIWFLQLVKLTLFLAWSSEEVPHIHTRTHAHMHTRARIQIDIRFFNCEFGFVMWRTSIMML